MTACWCGVASMTGVVCDRDPDHGQWHGGLRDDGHRVEWQRAAGSECSPTAKSGGNISPWHASGVPCGATKASQRGYGVCATAMPARVTCEACLNPPALVTVDDVLAAIEREL